VKLRLHESTLLGATEESVCGLVIGSVVAPRWRDIHRTDTPNASPRHTNTCCQVQSIAVTPVSHISHSVPA